MISWWVMFRQVLSSPSRNRTRQLSGELLLRYGVAVLSVAVALVITLSLWRVMEPIRFLFLFAAVMFSAWYGGFGSGLLATALAAFASAYYLMAPFYTLAVSPENILRLVMFVVIASLITYLSASRQRANKLLRQQAEDLRQSEQRFHGAFEGASIGVALVSTAGHFLQVNRSLCEIVGFSEGELLTKNFQDITHPEDLGTDLEQANRLLAGEIRTYEMEKRYVHQRGHLVWVLLSASLVSDPDDRPLYFVTQIQDITERVRARAEREQLLAREQAARAEADRANRTKDEFLATVSHDLRTPLTSMLMWMQMLKSGKLDAQASADAYASILSNIESLSRIINDLLDITRITTGKLRLEQQEVRLREVIEGAVETVRPTAEAKGIHIETQLAESAVRVSADPYRLKQVFGNLLTNAVKFTPPEGKIEVRFESEHDEARVTVRDTGCGISPAALPHIFDRFYQEEGHDQQLGLGLGLSISHHIIELHGGTIEAASSGQGGGATFTVRLPLQTQMSQASAR